MWSEASDIPAKYVKSSGMCIISNSSFRIKAESKTHDTHNRDLTSWFDEFFTVLFTAKNETTMKTLLSNCHHRGTVDSSTKLVWACVKNKNGVAKQCITQRELLMAPNVSGCCIVNFIKLEQT